MGSVDLIRVRDPGELAERAAGDWLGLVRARRALSPFCVALLGGRIAPRLFDAFCARVKVESIDLQHVHFFWGDERCVPPGDLESNFAAAESHLLRPLRIPPEQVHRIRGEAEAEAAARWAELDLRGVLQSTAPGTPVLDLVLLGMGEDGHVASLFPEEAHPVEPVLRDPRLYRPVRATKPPPLRITLGYGVIAAAREVWVLASGAGKVDALRHSIKERTTPLGWVLTLRGQTRVYTDIQMDGFEI